MQDSDKTVEEKVKELLKTIPMMMGSVHQKGLAIKKALEDMAEWSAAASRREMEKCLDDLWREDRCIPEEHHYGYKVALADMRRKLKELQKES